MSTTCIASQHTHQQMVFYLQTVCDPYTAGGDCRAERLLFSLRQTHLQS